MRQDLIERRLAERDVLVLDGALATELERDGFDLADPLWSAKVLIEAPEAIRALHKRYFEAGADFATTATYQATFEGFAARGIGAARAAELMRLAVELAREARDDFWSVPAHRVERVEPLVAASVGSYGAYLADGSEYRGDYGLGRTALFRFHAPRMRTLAASGADLLAFETIPSSVEAGALVAVLETLDLPAWLSFSCRDGATTCAGDRIEDCVEALAGRDQLVAIGINCTAPRFAVELVGRIRALTDKPIVAYPNSGERYDARARTWASSGDAHDFGELAGELYAAGARLIGGCCRTTPRDIAAIKGRSRSAVRP